MYCAFTTVGPFWYYKRTETKKQNANEGNATNNEVFWRELLKYNLKIITNKSISFKS